MGDTDKDGLSDGEEVDTYSTDPTNFDSDDDGYTDLFEITEGTDPNDPNDFPAVTVTPPPITITPPPETITENQTVTITTEVGIILSSVLITSALGITFVAVLLRKRRKII